MALEDDIGRLSAAPLLSVLEPDALRLLAFAIEAQTHKAGDMLFRRGDPAEAAFLVNAGKVELEAGSSEARSIVGAGTLIGEQALLVVTHFTATAVVREPAILIRLPRLLFMRMLREYPQNAIRLRYFWAQRLGRQLEAVKDAIRP